MLRGREKIGKLESRWAAIADRAVVNPRKIPMRHIEDAMRGRKFRGFIMVVPFSITNADLKTLGNPKFIRTNSYDSVKACFYTRSSSENIRAPGSAVSKTPS